MSEYCIDRWAIALMTTARRAGMAVRLPVLVQLLGY